MYTVDEFDLSCWDIIFDLLPILPRRLNLVHHFGELDAKSDRHQRLVPPRNVEFVIQKTLIFH
jgi:hypothetical protein